MSTAQFQRIEAAARLCSQDAVEQLRHFLGGHHEYIMNDLPAFYTHLDLSLLAQDVIPDEKLLTISLAATSLNAIISAAAHFDYTIPLVIQWWPTLSACFDHLLPFCSQIPPTERHRHIQTNVVCAAGTVVMLLEHNPGISAADEFRIAYARWRATVENPSLRESLLDFPARQLALILARDEEADERLLETLRIARAHYAQAPDEFGTLLLKHLEHDLRGLATAELESEEAKAASRLFEIVEHACTIEAVRANFPFRSTIPLALAYMAFVAQQPFSLSTAVKVLYSTEQCTRHVVLFCELSPLATAKLAAEHGYLRHLISLGPFLSWATNSGNEHYQTLVTSICQPLTELIGRCILNWPVLRVVLESLGSIATERGKLYLPDMGLATAFMNQLQHISYAYGVIMRQMEVMCAWPQCASNQNAIYKCDGCGSARYYSLSCQWKDWESGEHQDDCQHRPKDGLGDIIFHRRDVKLLYIRRVCHYLITTSRPGIKEKLLACGANPSLRLRLWKFPLVAEAIALTG